MAKISWNFHTVCHSVEKREILSHQKMFRQIKSLVTYLVKLFHRILAKNAMISTVWWKVWKLQKLTLKQFWDFREINIYNEITKELIWRNIFLVRVNEREITLLSRIFLSKKCKRNIYNFHDVQGVREFSRLLLSVQTHSKFYLNF